MEMIEIQTLTNEDEQKMVLDAEFTRDILCVYGDEPDWPSRIRLKELQQHFPEKSEAEIMFHLMRCKEAGLLDAKINRDQVLGRLTPTYYIGYVDGLTFLGSEFVQSSQIPKIWRKAIDKCITETGRISLPYLLKALLTAVQ